MLLSAEGWSCATSSNPESTHSNPLSRPGPPNHTIYARLQKSQEVERSSPGKVHIGKRMENERAQSGCVRRGSRGDKTTALPAN